MKGVLFVVETYNIDASYVKRLVSSGYGLGKVESSLCINRHEIVTIRVSHWFFCYSFNNKDSTSFSSIDNERYFHNPAEQRFIH